MTFPRATGTAVLCGTALCVVAALGPPAAGILLVALPLPLLVAGGVLGENGAAVACGLTGLALVGLWGASAACVYMIFVGAPAVVSVRVLRSGRRLEAVIAAALAAMMFGSLLLVAASGASLATLRESWAVGLDSSFERMIVIYRELGVPGAQLDELEAGRAGLVSSVVGLIPAIVAIAAGCLWLVNLGLSSRWVSWPQVQGLSRWQVAPQAVWLFIAAGFGMFAPDAALSGPARNLFAVMLAIYFLQGLAVVGYFLLRLRVPAPLRWVAIALAVIEQILAIFVLLLGVFDLWGDFRRLRQQPADALAGSD
jgi:hypothetical protein